MHPSLSLLLLSTAAALTFSTVMSHPTSSSGLSGKGHMPLQRAIIDTESADLSLLAPLEFQEKARRKPKKKNLKVSRLLRKMGSDFEGQWMSVEAPPVKVQVCMMKNYQKCSTAYINQLLSNWVSRN